MNVKKLSMDQLLQNLNESQDLIQLFHNLIRSHRKIIKSLKTVNQDGSREIHIQNNKNFKRLINIYFFQRERTNKLTRLIYKSVS